MKKGDPTFKKRFFVNTPIHYTWDVIVEKGLEQRFQNSWKRFSKKAEPLVSKTREKALLSCMKKIYREEDDLSYCDRVSIRYVSRKMGYGVFAIKDIPPYSVLNHYAGILRLDKDVELDNDSTFTFTDFKRYSIDASKWGNWTRFMNHADEDEASNNVVPWELYLERGPRIVFTAGSRGILKGEQLLYSYGEYYWDEDELSS